MKYRWIEDKTCDELSEELGCKVVSITRGYLIVGEDESITRRGVEIEFKETPTAGQLAKIDSMMPNSKRKADIAPVPKEL